MTRLPRQLHPGAWWLWAIGLAMAGSRTTNPLNLLLFCAVAGMVVMARRGDAPWALGFRWYVILALVIIVIRVAFRMLLGGNYGSTVLFTLPSAGLPDQVAGITIGGAVTLEGVLASVYDALRIATMLVCLGAANSLADPKRLLKSLPSALYEIGVAVTVALTVAPQLIESGQRIRRARKLRGGEQPGVVNGVLIPVLEDALDRSLVLAAAMDSRGYGRRGDVSSPARRLGAGAMLVGVCGISIGTYGSLDDGSPGWVGAPMLLIGVVLGIAGIRIGGRTVERSRYRPDPWRLEETLVAGCGIAAGVLMYAVASRVDASNLHPSLQPLRWPTIGLVPALAAALAALPAVLAPPPLTTAEQVRAATIEVPA